VNTSTVSNGDKVFAKRAVKSNKKKGRVGKIMIKHTGLWDIIEKVEGSSYRIHHCRSKAIDKKHAAHLSPCPEQLVPFPPLSRPDNSYSQIHRPIKKHPYMEAGIDEYNPVSMTPMANVITIKPLVSETCPSLKTLNCELGIQSNNLDYDITEPNVKPALSFPVQSAISLIGAPFQHRQSSTPRQPILSTIISKIIQIIYTNPHSLLCELTSSSQYH
jgi:hypothetical protein